MHFFSYSSFSSSTVSESICSLFLTTAFLSINQTHTFLQDVFSCLNYDIFRRKNYDKKKDVYLFYLQCDQEINSYYQAQVTILIFKHLKIFITFHFPSDMLIKSSKTIIEWPPGIENNNVFVTERLVDYKTVKLETMKHYAIYSKSLTYSIF